MNRDRVIRVAVVAAIQALLLGVVAWGPLSARFTGRSVHLLVGVADPTDPFREGYVDLSYPDLPQQPQMEVPVEPVEPEPEPVPPEEPKPEEIERGVAYVPLTRRGSVWVGGEISRDRPTQGVYLTCDDGSWRLRCGIESWFLPQGEDAPVSTYLRRGTAVATVRVDSRGHAALVDIRVP